jgi:hypothetical protein
MSNMAQSNAGLQLLDASAVELVAGGYDENNWCGSVVPRIPFPPRPTFDLSQVLTIPTVMG